MRPLLVAAALLMAAPLPAEEQSFTIHARATLTIQTPQGEMTAFAVGSEEVFRGESSQRTGIITGSGLGIKSFDPPIAFEPLPGRFLVCANCTAIAMKTFGINQMSTFETMRAAADAAPRDTPRPFHPDFLPLFIMMSAPPDFSFVKYPDREDALTYFGDGFRIMSYEVEITDAPVTQTNIPDVIPWICQQIDALRGQSTAGSILDGSPNRGALGALEDLAGGDCV